MLSINTFIPGYFGFIIVENFMFCPKSCLVLRFTRSGWIKPTLSAVQRHSFILHGSDTANHSLPTVQASKDNSSRELHKKCNTVMLQTLQGRG